MDILRQQHAEYYLALAELASQHFADAEQVLWRNRLKPEHDNLRTALEWLRESGNPEMALRFAATVWRSWHGLWQLSEGRQWLEQTLASTRNGVVPMSLRVQVLNGAGILSYLQCDYAAASEFHNQALALAHATDDKPGIGYALYGSGNLAMNQGNYAWAVTAGQEGVALARAIGDQWLTAMILNTLGEMARAQGDYNRALRMYDEGLALLHALGDKIFTTIILDNLGLVVKERGDYARAIAIHTHCLQIAHQIGDLREIALALERLGGLASTQKQPKRAARLFSAADALRQIKGAPVEALDRADYERCMAEIRAQLEEQEFLTAWAEGRTISLDQIVALAREDSQQTG
jgi:tetratricopeptide (TPR) repeat protein